MENEQRHYELRSGSRSRSQTPLVLGRALIEPETLEHHYDLRNRSRERSHTPAESTSSRRSGSRSLPSSSSKTYEHTIDTIIEKDEEADRTRSYIESQSKRPENPTRKMERRSERQKVKRDIFTNGQNERDNSFNQKIETRYKSNSPRRTVTSDYSSEEEKREDAPKRPTTAHEIYKQAGDWWNVFPKTDYTYSEKSHCRYEIAPGVLAMPNMSRRSIHSDSDTSNRLSQELSESGIYVSASNEEDKETNAKSCKTEVMDESCVLPSELHASNLNTRSRHQYTKKHVEQYHSHREVVYTVPRSSTNSGPRQLMHSATPLKHTDSRKYGVTSSIDSDTELEDAVSISSKYNEGRKITQYFLSFVATIVYGCNKVLEFLKLKTVRRREYRATYEYQRYEPAKYKIWWQRVDRCLQYVYLFMVKVFCFDSWLLSRFSSIRRWTQQRSPLILWIALLPLLLLTGLYIVKKQSVIHLDSLHNIPYDISETSYRIFNDIINLACSKNDLFIEHIKKLKNLPVYLIPSVNVSLPEMPPSIGSWCLPYLSTSFLPTKIITRQVEKASDLFAADKLQSFGEEYFEKEGDFTSITEKLNSRINSLEHRTIDQTNRLLNISRTLEKLKESDFVWSEYNNKMVLLEKNLEGHAFGDTHAHEIEAIKLQLKTLKELYSELKSCCNTHVSVISNDDLEKRIETIVAERFDGTTSKKDTINVIKNSMVAGDIKDPKTLQDESWEGNDNVVTIERMQEIVRNALRIYDADKTGRVDYALETAGGQIISTRCTQKYDIKTRAFKVLAFTLYHENNNPRTVIQGNPIQPGACWAFQGFPGYLLIKLRSFIYVTGFTVEHAPKSILPNGEMRSAPRKFNVWGFVDENDAEPVMFGDYEFAATDDSLQYFPVQNTTIEKPYEYVELRVHSNHGQLEYTCLYRFRVHGKQV